MDNKKLADDPVNREENSSGPSWSYPTIHFLYFVIYLVTPYIGEIVGLILFSGLMAVCTWEAVSKKQFEQLKQDYPSLDRVNYVANMLILPVILPLLVFVILFMFEIQIF